MELARWQKYLKNTVYKASLKPCKESVECLSETFLAYLLARVTLVVVNLPRFRKKAMAEQPADADVAQLVERNLAKVEVAGSNLVIRSNERSSTQSEAFFCFIPPHI